MGAQTSKGICGTSKKKNLQKSNTSKTEGNEAVEQPEEEDIDEGVLIEKNRDNYFTKEDFEIIAQKFPEYMDWMSQSMGPKTKGKQKRIKWKGGEIIGTGSFGKVAMGLNLQTGSIMAVKQVYIGASNTQTQQQRIKDLEMEIELLSQLSHKNIVRYLGSQKTKNNFNIFLEYISGGTIASLVEKYGPLNETLIRVYTRQILEGLEYLHVRNTIHRDIKGANVLVDNSGSCKLADFGTAKRISAIVDTGELRYMPSIRGTVNWMAPEVMRQTCLGRFSDIWSVGCTVLEMATGKIPWSHLMKPGSTQVSAMYQIATAKTAPPIPQELSPVATDFLLLCFKINPAERPNVMALLNHRFITGNESIEKPLSTNEIKARPTSGQSQTSFTSKKKNDGDRSKSTERPKKPNSVSFPKENRASRFSYHENDEATPSTKDYKASTGHSPKSKSIIAEKRFDQILSRDDIEKVVSDEKPPGVIKKFTFNMEAIAENRSNVHTITSAERDLNTPIKSNRGLELRKRKSRSDNRRASLAAMESSRRFQDSTKKLGQSSTSATKKRARGRPLGGSSFKVRNSMYEDDIGDISRKSSENSAFYDTTPGGNRPLNHFHEKHRLNSAENEDKMTWKGVQKEDDGKIMKELRVMTSMGEHEDRSEAASPIIKAINTQFSYKSRDSDADESPNEKAMKRPIIMRSAVTSDGITPVTIMRETNRFDSEGTDKKREFSKYTLEKEMAKPTAQRTISQFDASLLVGKRNTEATRTDSISLKRLETEKFELKDDFASLIQKNFQLNRGGTLDVENITDTRQENDNAFQREIINPNKILSSTNSFSIQYPTTKFTKLNTIDVTKRDDVMIDLMTNPQISSGGPYSTRLELLGK